MVDRKPSEKEETGAADHPFNTFWSEGEQENGMGAGDRCGDGQSCLCITRDPGAGALPAMDDLVEREKMVMQKEGTPPGPRAGERWGSRPCGGGLPRAEQ